MTNVELHRLGGQQVHGNGVARKCVYGEDVEVLAGFLFQGQAGIAHSDIELGLAVVEEEELGAGEPQDERVDFVKTEVVARTAVRGQSAGADRKSTRLNSSHVETSYAVFCLKKKKKKK